MTPASCTSACCATNIGKNRHRNDAMQLSAIGTICSALLIANMAPAIAKANTGADPYATLRTAYCSGNASLAAQAYSPDASFVELYPDAPPRHIIGRPAIKLAFQELFSAFGIDGTRGADLNFRIASSTQNKGERIETGYFRLRFSKMSNAAPIYGKFATRLNNGRFTFDASAQASEKDYQSIAKDLFDQARFPCQK